MVLTYCVAPSNLTVLARLMLLPEWASLSLYGFCVDRFLKYYLRNFHSYEEFLGPCNRHVFFIPISASLGWLAWFLLRLLERSFSGLDGEAYSPTSFFFCQDWHGRILTVEYFWKVLLLCRLTP